MKKLLSLLIILFFTIIGTTTYGASVIVNPVFHVEVDGEPLSGGLVYTYECGTTTPKTTYTDYTGGTENENPVELSTNGDADIYAAGCLKVIIKTSAGATIDDGTVDYLQGFDSSVLQDADRDTKIQCEESADEDVIRFDVGGSQKMYITSTGVYIAGAIYNDGYGRVERPKFRWKDADEIYIGAGAYHHSGTTEQLVYWNSELTFHLESAGSNSDSDDYGADGWHYIYLDDSAIVTQASALLDADCFVNDTTAPSYSATKHGWYGPGTGGTSTSDRCIFAIFETGDAVVEFHHDGGVYVQRAAYDNVRGVADLDTTWTAVDASDVLPGFATKGEMTFFAEGKADATVTMSHRPTDQTDTTGTRVLWFERIATDQYFGASCTVFTNTSQSFDVKLSVSDTDTAGVDGLGWYFPNGM